MKCEETSPPLFTVNRFPPTQACFGENVVLALKLVLQSSVSIEPDKEPDMSKGVVMWKNEERSTQHLFHRAG